MPNKYIILKGFWPEELSRLVQKHLDQGWKCAGGVASDHGVLFQAMIADDNGEPFR